MSKRRSALGMLVAAGALSAALALPATGVAGHDGICQAAADSGEFNVIVGAGTIVGTNGDDVIFGSAGNDTIAGGNGDDVICGRGGADDLDGGNGQDRILGDVCAGCAGENGAPGADRIEGGNGADTLWGDEGGDSLSGGRGDDRLFGGNPGGDGDETDTCDGGRGTDTATRCDTTPAVP